MSKRISKIPIAPLILSRASSKRRAAGFAEFTESARFAVSGTATYGRLLLFSKTWKWQELCFLLEREMNDVAATGENNEKCKTVCLPAGF